jgi:hypothetical protein
MNKTIFEDVADVVLDSLSQFDGRPWDINIVMETAELRN